MPSPSTSSSMISFSSTNLPVSSSQNFNQTVAHAAGLPPTSFVSGPLPTSTTALTSLYGSTALSPTVDTSNNSGVTSSSGSSSSSSNSSSGSSITTSNSNHFGAGSAGNSSALALTNCSNSSGKISGNSNLSNRTLMHSASQSVLTSSVPQQQQQQQQQSNFRNSQFLNNNKSNPNNINQQLQLSKQQEQSSASSLSNQNFSNFSGSSMPKLGVTSTTSSDHHNHNHLASPNASLDQIQLSIQDSARYQLLQQHQNMPALSPSSIGGHNTSNGPAGFRPNWQDQAANLRWPYSQGATSQQASNLSARSIVSSNPNGSSNSNNMIGQDCDNIISARHNSNLTTTNNSIKQSNPNSLHNLDQSTLTALRCLEAAKAQNQRIIAQEIERNLLGTCLPSEISDKSNCTNNLNANTSNSNASSSSISNKKIIPLESSDDLRNSIRSGEFYSRYEDIAIGILTNQVIIPEFSVAEYIGRDKLSPREVEKIDSLHKKLGITANILHLIDAYNSQSTGMLIQRQQQAGASNYLSNIKTQSEQLKMQFGSSPHLHQQQSASNQQLQLQQHATLKNVNFLPTSLPNFIAKSETTNLPTLGSSDKNQRSSQSPSDIQSRSQSSNGSAASSSRLAMNTNQSPAAQQQGQFLGPSLILNNHNHFANSLPYNIPNPLPVSLSQNHRNPGSQLQIPVSQLNHHHLSNPMLLNGPIPVQPRPPPRSSSTLNPALGGGLSHGQPIVRGPPQIVQTPSSSASPTRQPPAAHQSSSARTSLTSLSPNGPMSLAHPAHFSSSPSQSGQNVQPIAAHMSSITPKLPPKSLTQENFSSSLNENKSPSSRTFMQDDRLSMRPMGPLPVHSNPNHLSSVKLGAEVDINMMGGIPVQTLLSLRQQDLMNRELAQRRSGTPGSHNFVASGAGNYPGSTGPQQPGLDFCRSPINNGGLPAFDSRLSERSPSDPHQLQSMYSGPYGGPNVNIGPSGPMFKTPTSSNLPNNPTSLPQPTLPMRTDPKLTIAHEASQFDSRSSSMISPNMGLNTNQQSKQYSAMISAYQQKQLGPPNFGQNSDPLFMHRMPNNQPGAQLQPPGNSQFHMQQNQLLSPRGIDCSNQGSDSAMANDERARLVAASNQTQNSPNLQGGIVSGLPSGGVGQKKPKRAKQSPPIPSSGGNQQVSQLDSNNNQGSGKFPAPAHQSAQATHSGQQQAGGTMAANFVQQASSMSGEKVSVPGAHAGSSVPVHGATSLIGGAPETAEQAPPESVPSTSEFPLHFPDNNNSSPLGAVTCNLKSQSQTLQSQANLNFNNFMSQSNGNNTIAKQETSEQDFARKISPPPRAALPTTLEDSNDGNNQDFKGQHFKQQGQQIELNNLSSSVNNLNANNIVIANSNDRNNNNSGNSATKNLHDRPTAIEEPSSKYQKLYTKKAWLRDYDLEEDQARSKTITATDDEMVVTRAKVKDDPDKASKENKPASKIPSPNAPTPAVAELKLKKKKKKKTKALKKHHPTSQAVSTRPSRASKVSSVGNDDDASNASTSTNESISDTNSGKTPKVKGVRKMPKRKVKPTSDKESNHQQVPPPTSKSSSKTPLKKNNVAASKKTTKKAKAADDKFLQTDPCYDLVPKNIRCLECRRIRQSSNRNDKSKWDDFCRFYEFRKLKLNEQSQIVVAGFSDMDDAKECDKTLWMPHTNELPSNLTYDVAKFILSKVGNEFCNLVKQERGARDSYYASRPDEKKTWKRAVNGLRELCDVCSTTLFNCHYVCERCGFVVCIDCHQSRANNNSLVDTEMTIEEDCDIKPSKFSNEITNGSNGQLENSPEQNNNNNTNGSTNPASNKKNKRDSFGWLHCTKSVPHSHEQLTLAQIIAGDCLENVWQAMHKVRKELDKEECSCELSQQVAEALEVCISSVQDSPGQIDYVPSSNSSDYQSAKTSDSNLALHINGKLSKSDPQDAAHSWLCEGDLLVLSQPHHKDNITLFRSQWVQGKPLLVRGVEKELSMDLWFPQFFGKEFGDYRSDLVDCRNGDIHRHSMKKFWEGFESAKKTSKTKEESQAIVLPPPNPNNNEDISNGPSYYSGHPLWRLKDWPPGEDFGQILPSHYDDFMNNLPLKEYTTRTGMLNLACRLPKELLKPDLGPKMYSAYGSPMFPERGTTNLHLDMSDAINVMIYVSGARALMNGIEDARDGCDSIVSECQIDQVMKDQIKRQKLVPGALWHIFKPSDANKMRKFLNKLSEERNISPNRRSDPIHDQTWYLDTSLLKRLDDEYGVKPYSILQCMGDAILIPAGAPHQVKNLQNCIKVANDFVSPENVRVCLQLMHEFRGLPETHINQEDKLQIKNILYHSIKESLQYIELYESKECSNELDDQESDHRTDEMMDTS